MPQSFAIANKAKESGGNLATTADNTRLLLELVAQNSQIIRLLTAINVSLGKMGQEYTDPDDVSDMVAPTS